MNFCATCIAKESRKREGEYWCDTCARWRCEEHAVTDPHYVPAPEPDTETADLFGPEPVR